MRRTKLTRGPRNKRLRAGAGRALRLAANEQGYVLLWAIFGFVLVGGLLAATLSTAASERRAAGANAKWKASFYAAEAGLREALDFANDTLVGGLDPGQSMELAWRPVTTSTDYRAVIYRVDGGAGQKLFLLNVTGRSGGAFTGYSAQNLMFTIDAGPPAAAIAVNGPLEIPGSPLVSGSCAGVAVNGPLDVGGTLTTAGSVSSAQTVSVGGAIVDWEGNTVEATENADPVNIPPMAAADHCADADVTLRNGYVIDAAGDSITAESSASWDWDPGDVAYTLSGGMAVSGTTVCAFGSIVVSANPGTPASPLRLSLIATGYVQISGDPYLIADHPSGLLLLAEGDLMMNGNATGGSDNFAGLMYGGSQCQVSGSPKIQGQLICQNAPDPTGVKDIVPINSLNGDMDLTSACTVGGGGNAVPIQSRAWSPVF